MSIRFTDDKSVLSKRLGLKITASCPCAIAIPVDKIVYRLKADMDSRSVWRAARNYVRFPFCICPSAFADRQIDRPVDYHAPLIPMRVLWNHDLDVSFHEQYLT